MPAPDLVRRLLSDAGSAEPLASPPAHDTSMEDGGGACRRTGGEGGGNGGLGGGEGGGEGGGQGGGEGGGGGGVHEDISRTASAVTKLPVATNAKLWSLTSDDALIFA